MSKEIISKGADFVIEWLDRSYGGARSTVMTVSGNDGSVVMGDLAIDADGVVTIQGTAVLSGTVAADISLAAGKSLSWAAGAGGLDGHLATGAFRLGAASATMAFFGVAAVSKPSAYTQTAFATASKTMPAATSHTITNSSGGSASTSAIAVLTAVANAGSADLAPVQDAVSTLAAELVLVKADLAAAKTVINALIDDLQALGLVG